MKYEIVQASNVAKRAMRKVNKKQADREQLMKQKKYAMRQYRKMINAKKKASEARLDQDYSKYIEWAILATIALAVLSVSHPQVGILAIIFAILIVAAIMDTKIKAMANKHEKEMAMKEEKLEKALRMVQNENRAQAIEVKPASILEKTVHRLKLASHKVSQNDQSFTEFPYRNIQ
ncbi:MAG: hypothetical protein CME63_02145 [Halobacteriovoraceae bacterium]|nr:hypothetical protein [Halobacteriovoraceae bacterium]MBC96520.1 hypothetical protein [Halobacteriovoraceae bacterium]|tara:strand:- start:168694 stop:169221 length:528 start_codon:yes stop_codon:yes gene_type:complete